MCMCLVASNRAYNILHIIYYVFRFSLLLHIIKHTVLLIYYAEQYMLWGS